jgi:hypothetical protein
MLWVGSSSGSRGSKSAKYLSDYFIACFHSNRVNNHEAGNLVVISHWDFGCSFFLNLKQNRK